MAPSAGMAAARACNETGRGNDKTRRTCVQRDEPAEDWTGWMRQALDGNEAVYRRLLEAVANRLRATVRSRLSRWGSTDLDPEDIVQETLLAIHLKRHTWNRVEQFEPWLAAVARNKLIDALRRRGRRVELPLEDVEASLAVEEREAEDDAQDVSRLLATLDGRQQQIVRLISVEGHAVRTVAERLQMTEVAVRVSLHRSLKKLAALYGKAGR
jgi:RNA polymerase sigma-70 factor (ECF subfamily)